jgi:rhodanese-related sulfurtransferase
VSGPGSAVDGLLAAARRRLVRVDPDRAAEIQRAGGLLVDIRPVAQRREHGEIPGALVVERNVLEWRLDPTSPDRLEQADDPDRSVVVVCQEGYASSLAAAALQDLGLRQATDLRGGFAAWKAEGLPVTSGPQP